jgi:hypothetical protein
LFVGGGEVFFFGFDFGGMRCNVPPDFLGGVFDFFAFTLDLDLDLGVEPFFEE